MNVKQCPDCGKTSDEVKFYQRTRRCAKCHNARMVADRKKPSRRAKVRATNNAWLKAHKEVNRQNVAAFRARKRATRPASTIPPDRVTVREAVARLGITKQYVSLLIDQGQLNATRERGRWLIDRAELDRVVQERAVSTQDIALSAEEEVPEAESEGQA